MRSISLRWNTFLFLINLLSAWVLECGHAPLPDEALGEESFYSLYSWCSHFPPHPEEWQSARVNKYFRVRKANINALVCFRPVSHTLCLQTVSKATATTTGLYCAFTLTVFLLCNRPTPLCRKQSDSWLTRLKMYLNKAYYFILLNGYWKWAIKNVKRLTSMKSIYCSNVWGQILF